MNIIRLFLLLLMAGLGACIQTEFISEILEPKLTLGQPTLSLTVGQSAQLTATYTDEQLNDRSELIVWSSSAPGVVSVSPQGLAEGKSVGQAWAVATAPDGLTDSTLVTVAADNNAAASVEVLNPPAFLAIGETANFQARALNAAGQVLNGKTITWTSSDPAVLEMSTDGTAVALNEGVVQVVARSEGVASLPVMVQVLPLGGISRSGMFSGNGGYSVKGTATLRQEGSSLTLILESDYMSSNGPGLFVYLAKQPSGGLNSMNGLELGSLKSTSGMQTYAVPPGVGLDDYDYAVIYCKPFNVRFGTAQLNN